MNTEAEVSKTKIIARFRGLLPMFVELYMKSLGAQYEDGVISGEGWRGTVLYRKIPIGSLELTEAEITFEGDALRINEFLTKFRAISLRNWG